MSVKKKNEAIEDFCAPSRRPKVFIVSLKAGGVGLNLTVANFVFMVSVLHVLEGSIKTLVCRWIAGGIVLLSNRVCVLL